MMVPERYLESVPDSAVETKSKRLAASRSADQL